MKPHLTFLAGPTTGSAAGSAVAWSSTLRAAFAPNLRNFALAAILGGTFLHQAAMAQLPVNLGSADNFAVLAGAGITNTGATTINGDVGTFPTPAITGFGTVILNGANHAGDSVTQLAKTDLVTAYNDAAARSATITYAPVFDLVGLTLAPGVYNNPSSFGLTGTLTLDALGNPNAVWIFQTGSTLTTGANSIVSLIGGAQADNVYWQVGSSATLGTNSAFVGNILAFTDISLTTGATVAGRLLALNGAVTLQANTITLSFASIVVIPDGLVATIGAPIVVQSVILKDGATVNLLSTLTLLGGNLTVTSGSASINGGRVITPGAFNKYGPGTLIANTFLQVGGAANINQGALLVNETLQAPLTNVLPGALLGGSGTVVSNVFNSGTVAPGNNATGTLTVRGNYTQNTDGALQMEIGSLSSFDRLIVSGEASLAGTLQVVPVDGFSLEYGQQFPGFIQAGSVTGAFDSIIAPEGFRGRILQEGGSLTLLIAPDSYTQVAKTQNQRNVARSLDTFITATRGDRATVSLALDLLGASDYPAALDAISPAFYESLGMIMVEQINAQNQFLAQRMSAVRLGDRGFQAVGIESPLINDRDGKSVVDGKGGRSVMDAKDGKNIMTPAPDNKWGVWVQGNGIFGKLSNVNQMPNAHFESGGIFVGADYQWNEHITTGLFGGYQGVYSKYNNGGLTKINTGLFGGYATFQNGGFYSDAILTGGYSNYSTRRSIQFSDVDRTARGNLDGMQFSAYLDIGYDWKIGHFTLGPILAGQYTYVGISPFTEQGAGSLNLQVDQQNISSLRSSLGGRIAYTWNLTKKVALIPEVRMLWQHEFLENSRNMGASLDSGNIAGFGFDTSAPERDSVFAGAGVIAQLGPDWNASCYYNVDFGRQNYIAQMISVGLGWKF